MNLMTRLQRHTVARGITAALLLLSLGMMGGWTGGGSSVIGAPTLSHAYAASGCQLNSPSGAIQHVIYIQFDNVHFTRDNPNVPSDLEQMPHLLNFMEGNGVLLSDHHTPLISHTANDILTSLTGNYSNNVGQPVANSFGYFDASGNVQFASSFQYWTDPVSNIDTAYNLIDAAGENTPAPWVPYTRAGCDVGAFSTADIELENVTSDIKTVFTNNGNPAPAAEAATNRTKAVADFEGISIHCAKTSTLCSSQNGGEPDALPQEPGGYSGFNGLFGAKYVNPTLCAIVPSRCSTENGSPAVNDLNNTPVDDGNGNPGFPGFDPTATQTLGYVAAMQEAGVPITYAYIADAHDNHATDKAFGPGEAGYVAQLKAYDDAFATFFDRLAKDGINQSNTLFVFTADENDHFAGGPPTPANCDGVNVPCTYSKIGEVNANLTGLLATEQGVTTPFKVHSDSAPTIYINGNPARNAPVTRAFDHALGALTATNPITGMVDSVTWRLADSVEMKLLHMVTADPMRTPTLTMFADPDYYLFTGAANCSSPCVTEVPDFAWNHGDYTPDIVTTWLGMVGPGVRHGGVDPTVWSDHTDIRPTMMALLGLKDDYTHDGRMLFEEMDTAALPQSIRAHRATLARLADIYKQLDAAVGSFGLATLGISTRAVESPNDVVYNRLENQLQAFGAQRDALVAQIQPILEGAEFGNMAINEQQAKSLADQGLALLLQVTQLDNSLVY